MYSDDRVLVGVVKRKRDLRILLSQLWYRIPYEQFPQGIYEEYLAFYLSGQASTSYLTSGIHLYARCTGIELCYRRDLLPQESDHPRAGSMYYQIRLSEIRQLIPPIVNSKRRRIAFILTTWDRFSHAVEIQELYSTAPRFVKRLGN